MALNPALSTVQDLEDWFRKNGHTYWKLFRGERITETSQPLRVHEGSLIDESWKDLINSLAMFGRAKYALQTRSSKTGSKSAREININFEDFDLSPYKRHQTAINGHGNYNQSYNQPYYPPPQNSSNDAIMTGIFGLLQTTLNQQNTSQSQQYQVGSIFDPRVEQHIATKEKQIEDRLKKEYDERLKNQTALITLQAKQQLQAAYSHLRANPGANIMGAFSKALEKDGLSGLATLIHKPQGAAQGAAIGALKSENDEQVKATMENTTTKNPTPLDMNKVIYGASGIFKLTGVRVDELLHKMLLQTKKDPEAAKQQFSMLEGVL